MSPLRTLLLCAVAALPIGVGCSTTDESELGPEAPDAANTQNADAGTTPETGPAPVTPKCGDKKVDQGEECDDGNTTNSDGCSATCTIESAAANDVCPGTTLALTKLDASTVFHASIVGSTAVLYNHYGANCGGGSGADAVYKIDPPSTGRAIAKVTAGFGAVLSVRTACADTKTELACGDVGTGSTTQIQFPVFAGSPVFLFVDGYGGSKGDFTLDVDVETAVCGNGKAEYPETCDDGNTTGGDGCAADCKMEDTTTASACPGMGYRLAPGTISFAGDTTTLANGGGSTVSCAWSGGGNNAVYAITPTVTGNLALNLLANYPEALLHVRRDCGDNATQYDCVGSDTALTPIKGSIPVFAEQTVYVFVDGDSSQEGLYTIDATLTAATCGNGKLDGVEECDDGANAAGDGCSATCTIERDTASYTCPGKALRLESAAAGPRTKKLLGTTVPEGGQPTSKWSSCGSSTAPDVVYQVTSDIDGWLSAKVVGPFNTTVAIRTTCVTTGSDLACAKTSPGNSAETVFSRIDKETPVFVIVDGLTAAKSGPFELELTVNPSVCGNDVIEGGEQCDDGAVADGDGCSVTCQLEAEKARDVCTTAPAIAMSADGDGTFSGNVVSGTTNLTKPASPAQALASCASAGPDAWFALNAPVTGVATVNVTSANFRTTLGVRATCASTTTVTCDATNTKGGQQIVFPVVQGTNYFVGVAGAMAGLVGRFTLGIDVVPTGCGDRTVSGGEQCDDGNTNSGDGCSSTCALEPLAAASTCPGHAINLAAASATEIRRATATIDTAARPSKTGSMCGGSGPEGIFRIQSDIDGLLQVKTTSGYAAILYARTTCSDPASEIPRSCSGLTSYSTTVTKNVPYFLYVDGVNGASGVARLDITVTP